MSRHGKTNRRYLSTSSHKEPLIDGLPDTDKWANLYVEVSGNYEFGDQTNRIHHVPKVKDFRGLQICFFCRAQSSLFKYELLFISDRLIHSPLQIIER